MGNILKHASDPVNQNIKTSNTVEKCDTKYRYPIKKK